MHYKEDQNTDHIVGRNDRAVYQEFLKQQKQMRENYAGSASNNQMS